MTNVIEFRPPAQPESAKLSEAQRALMVALGADTQNPRWVPLRCHNIRIGDMSDLLVPAFEWCGMERVVLADGSFIPLASIRAISRNG